MQEKSISIIVPTLNEAGNVTLLVKRIARALSDHAISGEIIFVDDHSTDDTVATLARLAPEYAPGLVIRTYLKQGKKGKAFSLLEGFRYATAPAVAILDADLQYPPEAIPQMLEKIWRGKADVVIGNRVQRKTDFFRSLLSKGFFFFFVRFLHGLDCDSQSGLKVFRREILSEVSLHPSPWTFDLEFLCSARNLGYVLKNVPITFDERLAGESKINMLRSSVEIGWNALKLYFRGDTPRHLSGAHGARMAGAGVAHGRKRFITHTTLHHSFSALHTFFPWQRVFIGVILFFVILGLWRFPLATGVGIIAILSTVYFIDTFFNLVLVLKSLAEPPEIRSSQVELENLTDAELPVYSVLCPLYKEAHMLPGFVSAIERLSWPKAKLDVLLLLEENDPETIRAAEAMELPPFVRVVVVPHSFPKTKPKACNYGLSHARGEYVVIYDAEDEPDPWQLKKAFLGFQKVGPKVKCLQAKLNYFNPDTNLLTRFFTAEYSLWFDIILPGLQSIRTAIPLGGTSNHFRTRDLLELEGWDPFNVTEDCDLGVRIFMRGGETAIIDSVTLEEANSRVGNWLRQRSRWIKGYMQTYLVHMRRPLWFVRKNGLHALYFQIVVGGKLAFLFINPLLWATTIAYFTLYAWVGPTIQLLYPQWVFYMATISLVFGNFLYIYYYMIGCAKRGQYSVIKYVFLVPLYWVLGSISAYIALYELLVKPHYWQKTTHGLSVQRVDSVVPKTLWPSLSPRFLSLRQGFASLLGSLQGALLEMRWYFRSSTVLVPKLTNQPAPVFVVEGNTLKRSMNDVVDRSSARFWQRGREVQHWWAEGVRAAQKRLPRRVGRFIFSGQGFYVGALLLSNALNFVFNAYLGRVLDFAALSVVTLMNTFWWIAVVVIGAFSDSVNHRVAYLEAERGVGSGNVFFKKALDRAVNSAFWISWVWVILSPFLTKFFHVEHFLILLLFTPAFTFGVLATGYRGYLQGTYAFTAVGLLFVGESLVKFILAALLISFGAPQWAYLAIPLSIMVTAGLAYAVSGGRPEPAQIEPADFPRSFFSASVLFNLSSIAFLSVDILLVKHYLPETVAGQYALLSVVGKMIYFLGSLPNAFTTTFVSRSEGLKASTGKLFMALYTLVFTTVAFGVLVFGVWGNVFVPLLFGAKARVIVPWLLPYTVAIGLFTLTTATVAYHLAKRHFGFAGVSSLLSVAVTIGIVRSHGSLGDVVNVIFWVSVFGWSAMELFHVFYDRLRFVRRGFRDFLGIFTNGLPHPAPLQPGKKRILIFNWRDLKHVFAGGAEMYVHEIAKELVQEGNQVTLFCGSDGRSARHEVVDGIRIVRRGGFYLVYVWAFFYYLLRFRGQYDIVIDCENGIPFFTPLYVRKPVFCLLHHVHQDVFYYSLPRPLAWFASFLEKDLMPLIYRKVRFITVSESSKENMEAFGIGQAGIMVVNPGVNLEDYTSLLQKKTQRPTILYLGRLKAYKSVNVLIQAFELVLRERPDAELIIAGDGEERLALERLARKLNLPERRVRFIGRVSHAKKIRLLQSAWVFVNPSYREGWGIVNIEANAAGTPVIASNVPGLRDSVSDQATGFLVEYGDARSFANKILSVIADTALREGLSRKAVAWSQRFSWHRQSALFYKALG